MKIAKKLAAVAVSTLMMFSIAVMNVFAASTTQDGLEVSLTTDKEAYSKDEKITATLSVKNTNAKEVTDVAMEAVIPDGYEVADGTKNNKQLDKLAPNESAELKVVYVAKDSGEDNQDSEISQVSQESQNGEVSTVSPSNDSPKTGDNATIPVAIAIVLLVSVLLAVFCFKSKKGRKLLSVILTVSIIGGASTLSSLKINAVGINNDIYISTSATVGQQTLKISAKVVYSIFIDETNLGNEQVKIDKNNFTYNSNDDSYQTYDLLNNITGTVSESNKVKSFKLEIYNSRNELFLTDDIVPVDNWSYDNIVLDLGKNRICVNAEYDDGTVATDELLLNNTIEGLENLVIDYDDNDKDGLCNMIEDIIGTDKNSDDTDNDKISDYNEVMVLFTDPKLKDTDGNGIADGDEDPDSDGLKNIREFELGTNPLYDDTDSDHLKDKDEVDVYHTNPLLPDTDGDGLDDFKEIELGYDPNKHNDTFKVTAVPSDDEASDLVKPSVSLELSGEQVNTLSVTKLSDFYFDENTYGYIGPGYEFEVDGEFDQAVIRFEFDSELLNNPDFDPTIYYFDEERQELVELETTIEGDTAVAVTTHFSKYVLLDKKKLDEIWNVEIKVSDGTVDSSLPIDLAFVIDGSGSMTWNDSQNIRYEAAIELIDQLNKSDRVAVIGFDNDATVCSKFTLDKSISKNAVYDTFTDGGTSVYNGIITANELYKEQPRNSIKKMIVLTDGEDNGYYNYSPIIEESKSLGITIYTVGLGNVDEELLKSIAESTGGNYYNASFASDLIDEFENAKEDIDLSVDTDGDGICDYYENGRIRLGSGKFISTDPNNKDTDNDGIPDGEEIIVTKENGTVKFTYKSDPNNRDTDGDGLLDGKSIMGVAPQEQPGDVNRKNGLNGLWEYHINYVQNHSVPHSLPSWYNYGEHKNDSNTGYEGLTVFIDEVHDLSSKITNIVNRTSFILQMEAAERLILVNPPVAIAAFNSGLSTLIRYLPTATDIRDVCAELGSALLNFRCDDNNVIHSQFNQWQSTFGYNNLYDAVFRIGTLGNMRNEKFDFNLNGTDYIFWMWRGNYLNLGAGAEIGFYTRPESYQSPSDGMIDGIGNQIRDLLTNCVDHYNVDKSLSIPMNTYLYEYSDSSNITNVYAWDPQDNSTASNKQWWACGFNPEYVLKVDSTKLVLIGAIDMSSQPDLYSEFYREMINSNVSLLKYLYFDEKNSYVYVMWEDSVTKFSS